MSQKHAKKLGLLKTYYYKFRNQDGQPLSNATNYVTDPTTESSSYILHLTDKNYNPIKNVIGFTTVIIPANNPNSGITKQTFKESFMIKTKYGFVSANTFYFDPSSSTATSIPFVDYTVTESSGDVKNAVKVTIEFDNDGTIFSNGVKFARRVRVYGCK